MAFRVMFIRVRVSATRHAITLIQTLDTPMLNASRGGTGGRRAFPNSLLDARRSARLVTVHVEVALGPARPILYLSRLVVPASRLK
jgi:hypothetical protein